MQDELIGATCDARPAQQTIEVRDVEVLEGQLERVGATQLPTERFQFVLDVVLCPSIIGILAEPKAVRLRDDVFAIIQNEFRLRESPPEHGNVAFSNLLESMHSNQRPWRGGAWLEALNPRAHGAPGHGIEA